MYNIVKLCTDWNPGPEGVFCSWIFQPALFRLLLPKSRNFAGFFSVVQVTADVWVTSLLLLSSLSCSLVSRGPQLSHPPCAGHHSWCLLLAPERLPLPSSPGQGTSIVQHCPAWAAHSASGNGTPGSARPHRCWATERKGKPWSVSHLGWLWASWGASCSWTERLGMMAGPAGSWRGGLRMEKERYF